mmetsp:Transcript_19223/g.37704  ORF Transcript_19223/g.37704 Transcript_19223/m.37704 type:complete len:234 (-) Transcript_19223:793-1494(-)|eukprot:CAMPEP_0171488096 /NCGR_PEP_ID=MMETSP0958-20121227/2021_1 /TAXON_ID=87120 /ORGANISM="Aurantiochytrium limacinum, Strain ATCCMYA-1381" /LENGTH=233 /DNA_ID=CAMNT_0012021179 /DNA_START=34 /DNA_END=735 /DNA_ORIENTATION=+
MADEVGNERASVPVEADAAAKPVGPEVVRLKQTKLQSRVLYMNPVCMLVTEDPEKASGYNVMICSWLSMVNNDGLVMLSLNRRRYSCGRVLATGRFELAVAGATQAPLLLRIGKVTGRETDKFVEMDGVEKEWRPVRGESGLCEFVKGSTARIRLRVISTQEEVDPDHVIFFAKIEDCLVNADAWNGKQFVGPEGLLSFLGSQEFALIQRADRVQCIPEEQNSSATNVSAPGK